MRHINWSGLEESLISCKKNKIADAFYWKTLPDCVKPNFSIEGTSTGGSAAIKENKFNTPKNIK